MLGEIRKEKKTRVVKGREGERGDSRKLVLEKVKVAAIRSELDRERVKVITVGDVVCSGKEGVVKAQILGVEGKGRPKVDEGVGEESVYGDGAAYMSRKYLPFHEDFEWASKSIMAKIKNGTCISIIQQSFIDAGFSNFKVISFGGDNVLLHPCMEGDVIEIFNLVADLVGNFLYDCWPWTKDVSVQYVRGAWVRR